MKSVLNTMLLDTPDVMFRIRPVHRLRLGTCISFDQQLHSITAAPFCNGNVQIF